MLADLDMIKMGIAKWKKWVDNWLEILGGDIYEPQAYHQV